MVGDCDDGLCSLGRIACFISRHALDMSSDEAGLGALVGRYRRGQDQRSVNEVSPECTWQDNGHFDVPFWLQL